MYGIIYNPISGKGIGKEYALQISKYFEEQGEEVILAESRPIGINNEILENISGLIFVGGDGTIRPYYPSLAEKKIPVILFPAGNESLIAQQFSVDRDVPALYRRVKMMQISRHYYGVVNGEPFFLMCSVGFDAQIVHWVKCHRKDFSSNSLYLRAILSSLFKSPSNYLIQLENSFKKVRGSIIVANSAFYAAKLKLVINANSEDGLLRYSVLEGSYIFHLLKFILMRLGLYSLKSLGPVRQLAIKSHDAGSFLAQIDGDSLSKVSELHMEISDKSVLFY